VHGEVRGLSVIELDGVPELIDPVLIAAFEGWNDAADAATGAVEHLQEVFSAQPLGAFDPEDYYDFQVNRPVVKIAPDGRRLVSWPTTQLFWARLPGSGRDVVLVRGIEPNIRWRSFAEEVLAYCQELGVTTVVTLGALLADSPHTRPIPVSGTATDEGVARSLDLEISRYEGPTGIVGIVNDMCTRAGIAAVSLWAAVPHYVAQPPCPKATLALLRQVEELLDLTVPLGELPEDARAWERGVDELAAEDSEIAEYVRSLEEAKDTAELPEASGDAIAREFERYLRRRDEGPAPGAS
jgi:proteasome assembly chaperone (PAC2) family protein